MFKRSKICTGVLVALGGALLATPAWAQGERVEVTGSRIKRIDAEAANPVTVINRVEIERSGQISVADFLRNTVFNSQGSTVQASGSNTGSAATMNLRGLGSQYTVVLIDGRRATSGPQLQGGWTNINLIPTAAVERIEILRDSASAVYGADAIGGVVNIIMRKNYNGAAISVGYETPNYGEPGKTAAAVFGLSNDRGSVTIIADHESRNLLYNRKIRDKVPAALWNAGLSGFTSSARFTPNTAAGQAAIGAGTRSHPDAAKDPNNQILLNPDGSPQLGAGGGTQNAPRLPLYGFDHGATSAKEAALERYALTANARYAVTDSIEMFLRSSAVNTKTYGVYASAPVDRPNPLTIAADNPFNSFGYSGNLSYRFTPLGTRNTTIRDSLHEVTGGLRGSISVLGGADWEISAGHGRVRLSSVGENYGIGSVLQTLIDQGLFNPFDPTHPSVVANAGRIGHTALVDAEHRDISYNGHINFYDLFKLPGGSVQLVAGFERRESKLKVMYDSQSVAGNVFGSAGANTGGERDYNAVFAEALIPIIKPLNLKLAVRYDDYSDFGSQVSPQGGLEFRPMDSLMVRASYGKGFRAPTLDNLYGVTSNSNLNIPANAALNPPHPGGDVIAAQALAAYRAASGDTTYQPYRVDPFSASQQYLFRVGSNPTLGPEESTNWNVGIVFEPTNQVSVSLDVWQIEIDGVIASLPRPLIARDRPDLVTRAPSFLAPDGVTVLPGDIISAVAQVQNADKSEFSGIDLDVQYRDTLSFGRVSARVQWSHRLTDKYTPSGVATIDNKGQFGYPKDRGQLMLGYGTGPFDANFAVNFIGESGNKAAPRHSSGAYGAYFPDWTTFDLQVTYETPWKGKLTAGVRNLGDKFPSISSSLGFPNYDTTIYNSYGRTPYVRYEQRF